MLLHGVQTKIFRKVSSWPLLRFLLRLRNWHVHVLYIIFFLIFRSLRSILILAWHHKLSKPRNSAHKSFFDKPTSFSFEIWELNWALPKWHLMIRVCCGLRSPGSPSNNVAQRIKMMNARQYIHGELSRLLAKRPRPPFKVQRTVRGNWHLWQMQCKVIVTTASFPHINILCSSSITALLPN